MLLATKMLRHQGLADCVKYKRNIVVDGDCISFRIQADDSRQWGF